MDIFLLMDDVCHGLGPIVSVIKGVFDIVRIFVPIGLLIMGAVDLAKAVLASDDKEIKAAQGKLVKRAIAAAAVFFAVTLVQLVMNLVADSSPEGESNWFTCWQNPSVTSE